MADNKLPSRATVIVIAVVSLALGILAWVKGDLLENTTRAGQYMPHTKHHELPGIILILFGIFLLFLLVKKWKMLQ